MSLPRNLVGLAEAIDGEVRRLLDEARDRVTQTLRTNRETLEALAALLLAVYHGYGHQPSPHLDWRLQLHAWLALLAYALLGVRG